MRALLDAHSLIWAAAGDRRLSQTALATISDTGNQLFLSVVTAWEIAIKYSNGRLDLPGLDVADYVTSRVTAFGLHVLTIELAHALRVAELPLHHRDPFDRLLIAQAALDGLLLCTADSSIAAYDVDRLEA